MSMCNNSLEIDWVTGQARREARAEVKPSPRVVKRINFQKRAKRTEPLKDQTSKAGNGMTHSDEELVLALQRRELWAFKALYYRHKDPMLRIALKILGNQADSEDAVQDAFLTLYRKAAKIRGTSAFFTWFYRVVVNACLKIRDKRTSAAKTDQEATLRATDRETCVDSEVVGALDEAIGTLPLQQRMVFVLSEVEGFPLTQVAEILGLRAGTVRYHLFRARGYLRDKLRPFFEDDPWVQEWIARRAS